MNVGAETTLNQSRTEKLFGDLLYITERPSIPVGPLNITAFSHDSVSLTWNPPTVEAGYINRYRIEKREVSKPSWEVVGHVDSSQNMYIVRNLRSSTEYFFRVIAENVSGTSQPLHMEKSFAPRTRFGAFLEKFSSVISEYMYTDQTLHYNTCAFLYNIFAQECILILLNSHQLAIYYESRVCKLMSLNLK